MPVPSSLLRVAVALAAAGTATAKRADRSAATFSPVAGKAVAAAAAAIGGGSEVGPLWARAGNRQGGFKNRKAPKAPETTATIGQKPVDLLREGGPFDQAKFERDLDWGLESFEEAHYTLNENPTPVKPKAAQEEAEEDMPVKALKPRAVNAQVIVVRQDEKGDYWVLLHRRSRKSMGSGRLSVMSGGHEGWEEDSHVTAIREVVEEAGLLDAEQLDGAIEAYHDLAEKKHAPVPKRFEVFKQSAKSDWWVLEIQGEGVFTPKLITVKSADIRPMLTRFGRDMWTKAPVPGHAWFRLDRAPKIPQHVMTTGLGDRLKQVHYYLTHSEPEPPAVAPPSQATP